MLEEFGRHAGYIAASYAITVAVIAGLILWVRHDGRAQQRALETMKSRGLRRRSTPQT
ncbi:heme exporter protein CcmD [Tepidamorphus sp. 3E244]|uniref:heme exporter protein CcmD n=1 Tax=Tepidamorphus sp. 3E244 TaxID=3385498 RepID=UPI0038FD15A1